MKKTLRNLLSTLAALTMVAFALNMASIPAFADDGGCSVATLVGSYGIESSGSIVALGPIGPVVEVGIATFDGVGNVSQTSTVSLNGTIVPDRSSLSGTYQVNPDCTGDLALVLPVGPGVTITSTAHFVIVDHGKEIRLVNTGTGRVLVSNARKR